MRNIDNKIHEFIDDYLFSFAVAILLTLTFVIRLKCIYFQSGDYTNYFLKWYEEYRNNGGFRALGYSIGDYYALYNILIAAISYIPIEPLFLFKGISIIFEYLSAYVIYKITYLLLDDTSKHHESIIISIVFLFLPIVWLDSGGWVQCDIIYTFFTLCCIYACMQKTYARAFLYFSIGFCFKLQTIFILPLLIMLYINKKSISIFNFLIIPATYFIVGLPAFMAGNREIYSKYYIQIFEYQDMFLNFPNFSTLLPNDYEIYAVISGSFCILLLILATLYLKKENIIYNNVNILRLSIWVSMTCVMFLPSMHERYGFIPIILISVYYMVIDRRKLWIAIVINIIFMIIFETHARVAGSMIPFNIYYFAYIHLGIYVYMSYDFINKILYKSGYTKARIQ